MRERLLIQGRLALLLGIDVDYVPPRNTKNDPKMIIFADKFRALSIRFAELVDDVEGDSTKEQKRKKELRASLLVALASSESKKALPLALNQLSTQLAAEGFVYVEGEERKAA